MLNWTTGAGTARYWTLSLMLEHYGQPGGLSFWPAYSSAPDWVYAQAFQNAGGEKSLLLVSKVPVYQNITLTLDWTNANIQVFYLSSVSKIASHRSPLVYRRVHWLWTRALIRYHRSRGFRLPDVAVRCLHRRLPCPGAPPRPAPSPSCGPPGRRWEE
jgi:hypothetical protein